MKLTVLIMEGTDYLVGYIKELPGVITQGRTVAEVMENIQDALSLYLEDMNSEEEPDTVIEKRSLVLSAS